MLQWPLQPCGPPAAVRCAGSAVVASGERLSLLPSARVQLCLGSRRGLVLFVLLVLVLFVLCMVENAVR